MTDIIYPIGWQSPVAEYIAAMETMFDNKAKERHYDSRYTCALRAGYLGPFQAEGEAFAIWMDTCNAKCFQILDEVQSGVRSAPGIAELLAELPEMVWPV